MAVGQNLLNRNPASILASASGLHPLLRLLYARFGERYCSRCGSGLTVLSEDEIIERLVEIARTGAVKVFVPLAHRVKGSHMTLLRLLAEQFDPGALVVDGQAW